MDQARVTLPADFPLRVCFDGKTLFVANETEFVLRLITEPAVKGVATPMAGANIPGSVISNMQQDLNLIPPHFSMTVVAPDSGMMVNLAGGGEGVNKTWVIMKLVLEYTPVGTFSTLYSFAQELVDVTNNLATCLNSSSWVGDIGCRTGFAGNVAFASGRAGLSLGKQTIGALLSLVELAQWSNIAASQAIALQNGTRTLSIGPMPSESSGSGGSDGSSGDVAAGESTPASGGPSGPLQFAIAGSCTADGGTLNATTGNFTPGGQTQISVWKPDGNPYTNIVASGTVRSNGTIVWTWPCAGDAPGTYTTEVVDQATGRTTGRVAFSIGAGSPPPPPPPAQPATMGFYVADSFLGGTWARTDPNDGTWYSKGNRPANGAYWYNNGLGVAVDCVRSAATYTVKWADGRTETWRWWLHVTDGKWIPAAVADSIYSDGNPGLPTC